MKKITAFAPATVANVCCGFDILGFAIFAPADEVTVSFRKETGIVIQKIVGDGGRLPLDSAKNTAGVAVQSFLNAIDSSQGVAIEIKKKLPLGSGMGSSASSAAAALVAINELMGNIFTRKELVPFALAAEKMACGVAHADNVAPSIMGGFVLVRDYENLDLIQIPSFPPLSCCLVHPHLEVNTSDSRKVLKSTISLKDSLTQNGNLATLMVGLMSGDYSLISRSLHDVIAEPERSAFIPDFKNIKNLALSLGALGFGISGSGPSVFALCKDEETAKRIGKAVSERFQRLNLGSDEFISGINNKGAWIE